MIRSGVRTRIFIAMALALLSTPGFTGGFLVNSNLAGEANTIIHPFLYLGDASALTVRVCTNPGFSEINDAEPAIIRAISTWSELVQFTRNVTSDVPVDEAGFESVIAHELGHCALGLAHPNLGITSSFESTYVTNALPGGDEVFDFNVGFDGIPGSLDDIRGDDVNRIWFHKFDNDPFLALSEPIDTTTYSVDLADLPPGHSFVANANRFVAVNRNPPLMDTEALMTAGLSLGEGRRRIQADDFATMQLAMAGKDGVANTNDEYTVLLQYQGRSSDPADCDVILESTTAPEVLLGICEVSSISIGGGHFRLAGQGLISIRERSDWYYGGQIFSDGFEEGNLFSWSSSSSF